MKKFTALLLSFILVLTMTAGCQQATIDKNKINIATTSYALKYFIEKVGGDEVHVIFSLTGNPHHFELSQNEAQYITEADAFINIEAGDYINIGSQIKKINQTMKSFDIAENIDLLISEDNHVHHNHDDDDEHTHEEETLANHEHILQEQLDPHIWLDPVRTEKLVDNLAKILGELDADKATFFQENAQRIIEKLTALNQKYSTELKNMQQPYIVVNHAAYGYLAERYHFTQRAINDVSDHSENTQSSMIAMDDFIVENHIKYILVEANLEKNAAIDVLAQKHQLEILPIFNLETAVPDSTDYFELMEQNLAQIKKATV